MSIYPNLCLCPYALALTFTVLHPNRHLLHVLISIHGNLGKVAFKNELKRRILFEFTGISTYGKLTELGSDISRQPQLGILSSTNKALLRIILLSTQ